MPHTHSKGTSVRVRHIRSGVERPVPFQDRFYDPNYQTMRRFEFDLMPVSLCWMHLKYLIECNELQSAINFFNIYLDARLAQRGTFIGNVLHFLL